jgi:hypothetical protein
MRFAPEGLAGLARGLLERVIPKVRAKKEVT